MGVLMVMVSGCRLQTTDKQSPGQLMVEASTPDWRSALGAPPADLRLFASNTNYWEKVPTVFVQTLARSARLTTDTRAFALRLVSENLEQQPDPEGDISHLQPAELVFDAAEVSATGWNVLRVELEPEAVSDEFLEQEAASFVFRFDSAPAVVGVRVTGPDSFGDSFDTLTISFSELVEAVSGVPDENPFVVEADGEAVVCLNDGFSGWPTNSVLLRCRRSFLHTVHVELRPGALEGTSGAPVAGVDGQPFSLSVSLAELPRNVYQAPFWRPAAPLR